MNSQTLLSEPYKVFREALAAGEAYRRLGFRPDDIYLVAKPLGPSGCLHAVELQLITQGKRFALECGTIGKPNEWLQQRWAEAVDYWNTAPEPVRSKIYAESRAREASLRIVLTLRSNGFVLPCEQMIGPYTFW